MKKTLFSLAFCLTLTLVAQAQIVITEIMYNPPESGNDSLEYFELYNLNNSPTDLSGWSFTQGINYTFPAGTIMQPGSYLVLAKNAGAFATVFGFAPDIVWASNDALTNGGEDIELRDAMGNVQDYVNYLNALPWPPEAAGFGPSIVLCDFTSDNNLAANWQAATTGTGVVINGNEVKGNPGAASNCGSVNNITAVDDDFNVPSGQSSVLLVQNNDLVVNPLTIFELTSSPLHGSAVISGNTVTYSSTTNYCGDDQFSYRICDATGCDTASVMLTVKCYPQRSIASVTNENPDGTADSINVNCSLTGTVYGVNLRPINNNQPALLFTIMDNSGNGISVSSLGGNFGYTVTEGDNVTVQGTIGQFNGMTEIRPDTIIKLSANNPLLNPVQVSTLSEATESKLVSLEQMYLVDQSEWTTGTGSSGFNVRAVSLTNQTDTIQIRIDRDVENYSALPPQCQTFTLIGIGGQFDSSNPYNSGYQILPRYNADIQCNTSTKNVDYSQAVQLAPNPTQDVLYVYQSMAFDKILLLNALGQIINTLENPETLEILPVSSYAPGIYFLRFEIDGKAWTTKFVKQ